MLGRGWYLLPLNLAETLVFGCRSTRESPYGRWTTRRLIRWVSNLELVALETVAVNRRCGGEPDGSYLLAGQIVRTKNPMQKDAGQQIWPASSIYRKYSNAATHKSDSHVSGGAY